MTNDKIIEEFREKFELHDLGKDEFTLCCNNPDGTCDGGISIAKESEGEAKRHLKKVEMFILDLLEQKEREVIDKIKYHFETMVFDATVINVPKEASEQYIDKIMEFRREQSKYLSTLKSEGK